MDRQRLLLVFGGAWIAAALLVWFLYAQTQTPKTEKTLSCVAVTRDLPAGTRLKKSDIRLVRLPEKSLPHTAILDEASALDRVLLFPVNANETLTTSRLTSSKGAEGLASTIDPGMRAISVQINDSSGVAGLIQPRSHVDVLFTRPGTMAEAVTTTILEDIVVLSVGRITEVSQNASIDPKASRPQSQAATLLVTPEQARKSSWRRIRARSVCHCAIRWITRLRRIGNPLLRNHWMWMFAVGGRAAIFRMSAIRKFGPN